LRSALRVAHVTPTYFSPDSIVGGGERYVDYLTKSLRLVGGFEQCVFTAGPEDRFFAHDGIPMRMVRNESPLPGPMDAFSAAFWRELPGFDLVHVYQSLTVFGAYTVAIARSLRIPVVGTDLGGGANPLMLDRRGIELFDGVVSISRYAHDLIANFFSGKHEVLIGPVDTDHFRPAVTTAPGKTPDEADVGRRIVLCVGRIMPHKGFDRVVAALPSDLRLVIAGRVYHEPYYALLRQMAAGKDVHFVHDADDDALLALYRSADLYVQATTACDVYGGVAAKPELMGLTTLEAMSCGLPAAVTDTGSLPELVPDPNFGRVFSSDSELSAILSDVALGSWPNPDAGGQARAHVVAAHGMLPIGKRLREFYEGVVSERGRD
jgi:glycosyltransferase involved in cell wall biosynthesis